MDTVAPNETHDQPKRRPPPMFFALGHGRLPAEFSAVGVTWRFRQAFKHDFFAATGLYERMAAASTVPPDMPPLAVLKVERTYPLCGLPMRWLGSHLARHEMSIFRALQDVPGIPRLLGTVGPAGFLHEFIPGRDLQSAPPLTPEFFDRFQGLLSEMHRRHVAYVDCNKRDNIVLGDDGRPWLIDFQISLQVRGGALHGLLTRWIFRRLVRADWYHFYKHKTRLLPDACSPQDFAAARRRGLLHRLHGLLTRPLVIVRRKFLARYDREKPRWN